MLEVAGGAGPAPGMRYPPLTTGAAVGIARLTAGALAFHRRAGDTIGTAMPALVLGLAVALTAALDLAGRCNGGTSGRGRRHRPHPAAPPPCRQAAVRGPVPKTLRIHTSASAATRSASDTFGSMPRRAA